jgi:hypothetical protein
LDDRLNVRFGFLGIEPEALQQRPHTLVLAAHGRDLRDCTLQIRLPHDQKCALSTGYCDAFADPFTPRPR